MIKTTWLYILCISFLMGMLVCSYWMEVGEYIRSHGWFILLKYAGWFSALIALFALVWQVNQASHKMEIELILKMAEKFDSAIMQKHRVKSSKSFLDGSSEENSSTDAILNFFEEIDYLLEKQSISTVAIWHYFSYWITGYYWATVDYRKEAGKSETDVLIFVGIEKLYKKLLAIDKKNFNKARKTFKEHDLNDIPMIFSRKRQIYLVSHNDFV